MIYSMTKRVMKILMMRMSSKMGQMATKKNRWIITCNNTLSFCQPWIQRRLEDNRCNRDYNQTIHQTLELLIEPLPEHQAKEVHETSFLRTELEITWTKMVLEMEQKNPISKINESICMVISPQQVHKTLLTHKSFNIKQQTALEMLAQ